MGNTAYYMRTSHYLQNIGTQIDKVEAGWIVYEDKGISGRISFQDRPAGKKLLEEKLLADIRRGKISSVVVLRLDRLGRSTQNMLEIISEISLTYKIPITSLNEGIVTLDSKGNQTPMTGLLINILSSLSEFFYHQNREKTMSGIERAKSLGKYTGRKEGSTEPLDKFIRKTKVKKVKEMLDLNIGVRKICRLVECSPNFVYKVKDRLCMRI
jgi:DNA invertase Pin-like site-specific DNA recombinase